MMPEFRVSRADEIGREFQDGIVVEVGGQPFLGQFDAIAFDAREADFQSIAIGGDRFDLNRFTRRLRRRDDRLGGEVERERRRRRHIPH